LSQLPEAWPTQSWYVIFHSQLAVKEEAEVASRWGEGHSVTGLTLIFQTAHIACFAPVKSISEILRRVYCTENMELIYNAPTYPLIFKRDQKICPTLMRRLLNKNAIVTTRAWQHDILMTFSYINLGLLIAMRITSQCGSQSPDDLHRSLSTDYDGLQAYTCASDSRNPFIAIFLVNATQ